MTSKQRILTAMRGGQPDGVPVAPDISNMIPCRLTGKPFWDIYLYQDPPRWQAYINAVKYFGFDGWLDSVPIEFDDEVRMSADHSREAIIGCTADRIYTRAHATVDGREQWSTDCNVYYVDNPPTRHVPLAQVGLPEDVPAEWEDVHPRTTFEGIEAYSKAREWMGDAGVVGLAVGLRTQH